MFGFKKKAAEGDQREAQMRMKKFEAIARKPGVNIRDLEKLLKHEGDSKNAKNMAAIMARIKKDQKVADAAKSRADKVAAKATVAAKVAMAGKPAAEDPKAIAARMKKFEAVAKKPNVKLTDLQKLLKHEGDSKNAKNMAAIMTRIRKDQKVAEAAKAGADKAATKVAVAATPATPRKPAAMDPREMQARLKKFKAMAGKTTVDIKRLEKEVRAQKDPTLRREMEKELNLVKKTQARKK